MRSPESSYPSPPPPFRMEPHPVFWYDGREASPDRNRRCGGEGMTFDEVLEQALEMLRRRGRVSYRALHPRRGCG